jgi:hypothetical protein
VAVGCIYGIRIKANGNTVLSDIEMFADVGLADRVYYATAKDCFTSPYFVDRTPWMFFSFTNELAAGKIYYTITNNGANDSTYDIEMFGVGRA